MEHIDVDAYMATTRFYEQSIKVPDQIYLCWLCSYEVEDIPFEVDEEGIYWNVNWVGPFGMCALCLQHYELQ